MPEDRETVAGAWLPGVWVLQAAMCILFGRLKSAIPLIAGCYVK